MDTGKTNSFVQSITDLLYEYCNPNDRGEWILDVVLEGKTVGTLYRKNPADQVRLYKDDHISPLSSIEDDELLYDIYRFLDANKYLRFKSKNAVVEHEAWEDLNWKMPPTEIKAQDGEVIGRVGVTYGSDGKEGGKCIVIFISPDNTYATLTCYEEKDKEQINTAGKDLEMVAACLLELADILNPPTTLFASEQSEPPDGKG